MKHLLVTSTVAFILSATCLASAQAADSGSDSGFNGWIGNTGADSTFGLSSPATADLTYPTNPTNYIFDWRAIGGTAPTPSPTLSAAPTSLTMDTVTGSVYTSAGATAALAHTRLVSQVKAADTYIKPNVFSSVAMNENIEGVKTAFEIKTGELEDNGAKYNDIDAQAKEIIDKFNNRSSN